MDQVVNYRRLFDRDLFGARAFVFHQASWVGCVWCRVSHKVAQKGHMYMMRTVALHISPYIPDKEIKCYASRVPITSIVLWLGMAECRLGMAG